VPPIPLKAAEFYQRCPTKRIWHCQKREINYKRP
jgi:hypothetical protein